MAKDTQGVKMVLVENEPEIAVETPCVLKRNGKQNRVVSPTPKKKWFKVLMKDRLKRKLIFIQNCNLELNE